MRISLPLAAFAAAIVASLSLAPAPVFAQQKFITVGTGGIVGVYYPLGGAVCRFVNAGRKSSCGDSGAGRRSPGRTVPLAPVRPWSMRRALLALGGTADVVPVAAVSDRARVRLRRTRACRTGAEQWGVGAAPPRRPRGDVSRVAGDRHRYLPF